MKNIIRKSSLLSMLVIACLLNSNNSKAQYCTPTFYYPCSWYYLYINSFSTTGGSTNITSNNTGCSNTSTSYTYFNTRIHTGIQGNTVNFTLVNTPYYAQTMRIWVDFNIDGDFTDAGEEVYSGNLGYGSSVTGSFTIPITATPGNSRLRVRSTYQYSSAPQPCGSAYYGECEDYGFVIVAACSTSFAKKIGTTTEVCVNGKGSITVDATNGVGYQWQVLSGSSFVNLTNDAVYSGVNNATLSMNNIPSNLIGAKYRCLVTPSCGSTIKNPSDTTMLVQHPDVKLVSQPYADTACEGLNTKIFFKADDVITSGRWQIYNKTIGDYIDITGLPFLQNKDTIYGYNLSDTLNGARIRCIFEGVCGSVTTAPITMTVNPIPAVITHPVDQYLKPGNTGVFKIDAAGVGVKYQWQVSAKGGNFANINNNGIYDGVKTNYLRVQNVSHVQNEFEFRCEVKGTGNCGSAPDISNVAILYVEPAAGINDIMQENSITIFPNPAKGEQVLVKIEQGLNEHLSKYTLTDKTGKTISVGNLNTTGTTTEIKLGKLSPDVYFITVLDNDDQPVRSLKFTKL